MTVIGNTAANGTPALSPGGSSGPSDPTLVGDSARIAVAVALSRVTGLLRIIVAASMLGATVLGDLFVAINVLPLTLYDVFAGSAISSVLVPPLVRLLGRRDRARARRLAANALGVIGVLMVAVTLVAILARSLLAGALTAGVDAALAGDARAVASLFLLLIIPQIVIYAAIGVLVSVQHANRRFLLPSAAPVVENVGLLLTIVVAWWRYGSGFEVDGAPTGLVLTLAIGSGLSVLAHAAVQLVGAVRAMGPLTLRLDWRDPEVRALRGPAQASLGWSGTLAARQFALIVAAAYAGAGGVQAFEIAILVYYIPLALVGRPIASAALPRLAGASERPERLLAGYRDSLRLAVWPAVAAGLAMVLLGRPLAEAVGHGRFDGPEATRLLVFGLAGLGVGAFSEALFEVARQTTMALGQGGSTTRRRGLVLSTWLRIAAAIVGIPAVVVLVDGPAVLLGLGLVVSAGDLIALAVVHRSLRADPAWIDDGIRHRYRIGAAAVLVLVPAALVDRVVAPEWHPWQLVTLVVAAVAAYGGVAWLATGRGRLLADLADRLRETDDVDPETPCDEEGPCLSPTVTATRGPEHRNRRRPTPVWLISIYAIAMPLLAGLPRGVLFPVVRPSEALQAAVTVVALALVGVAALGGRRWRARLHRMEWWLLATAGAASVLPLLWLAARGRPIGVDELLASLPFVKYTALYILVRGAVRSADDVLDVARALACSAIIVAFIAVAQGLKFGPVLDVLGRFFVSSAQDLVDDGRGTTTIGSSIATGAYLVLTGALALSLGLTPGRRRWLVPAAICFFGAVASGQAGTLVGLVVIVATVARRHRRLAQLAAWSLPLSAVGLVGLWSVVASRLEDLDQGSGLPTSWLIRWNNISELYLPSLKTGGWLLGVSPDAVVAPPDVWRTTVYLESGYLWLLWVGGLPLLVATAGFLISAHRSLAPEARTAPTDPIGATRAAAAAGVAMMAVLSIIDPHLTLRAGADVFFILLALAAVDRPLFEGLPTTARRWSHLLKTTSDADPSVRLQLSEIPLSGDRREGRPETRLALTTVRRGHRTAAVELALHRTGSDLRGVLGPISAGAAVDRALLWRAVVLCADSLRLVELRLDAAEPTPFGAAPAHRGELVAAARLARWLEEARRRTADREPGGDADPAGIRRTGPSGRATRPPVRLEVGSGVGWGKRTVDLVVGGLALIVLAPVWLVVVALVRRSGRGPVVFRQVRIGTGGLPFQIAKFRTMTADNDDSAHRAQNRRELLERADAAKDGDDPRITPVGHWLRRLSLDELPQLVNVLRGEMSLVGPRPSLLWESELFEPRFRRRLVTKPGLTGLWQVSGRADVSMTEMLELDLGYVDRMGPAVDLHCLVRTAGSVMSGEGAR